MPNELEHLLIGMRTDNDNLSSIVTSKLDSGWCRASYLMPHDALLNRPAGLFDQAPSPTSPIASVGVSIYTVNPNQITPPGGLPHNRLTYQHNLGIMPTRIQVFAGLIADDSQPPFILDISPASISQIPSLYYDGAQGQYVGFAIVKNDISTLTLALAPWVAYNEFINSLPNSTGWYAMDYTNLYLRVVVYP